jgi:hypothetical protein
MCYVGFFVFIPKYEKRNTHNMLFIDVGSYNKKPSYNDFVQGMTIVEE